MDGNGFGRWGRHGGGIGRRHWESALGGGIGQLKIQQQHWAAPAAEEHATMASESASWKPKAHYYNIGVSVGKDGERGCIRCGGHRSEAMARKQAYCSSYGSGVSVDTMKVLMRWGQGTMAPDHHRQGEGDATMASPQRWGQIEFLGQNFFSIYSIFIIVVCWYIAEIE